MAGTLTDEYMTAIKPKLENAIDIALAYMGQNLREELEKSAWTNVYSYQPPPWFMEMRRYELMVDQNYPMSNGAGQHSLEIRNVTVTQGGWPNEVDWVESGFRQHRAGARPFMEEGLQKYAREQAEGDLRHALEMQGF